jgi:hypothetical protein
VKASLSYHLNKLLTFLMAPIYYHFGQYSFVLDLLGIAQDLIDVLGTYFLNFLFIGTLVFYRNFFLQIFNKFFYKNYTFNKNYNVFLNYIYFFFTNLNKTFNFLNRKFPLSKKNKKK